MTPSEHAAFTAALADRYRIEREIGSGGWATVFLAHDVRDGREVAIKMLRIEQSSAKGRARFVREIRIDSALQHPNIVPLLESGDAAGIPYFVMPFMGRQTLARRLQREQQLPVPDAVAIALDVAEALAYAHAADIIHRDIKPANILLHDGRALVADFGIARAMTHLPQGESITSKGTGVGTAAYMSPEQGMGAQNLDGRTDIYSLGCVLYEMLAGGPPFAGPTPSAISARHAHDPIPPLLTVRRTVPASVEAIVYRALSKSPADRFASAADMAQALDEARHSPLVSELAEPRSRLRRAAIGAVAALALAAVGWNGWSVVERQRDARLLAAADTNRIVLLPLAHAPGAPAALATDEALRTGMRRWVGPEVIDPAAVQEALGGRSGASLAASDARTLALRLRARRYVRGTVSTAPGGVRVHAMLFDAATAQSAIAEGDVAANGAGIDSALARLASRLLLRTSDTSAADDLAPGTRSLPARQAFLQGSAAMRRWALAFADSQFASAARLDPSYAQASLGVALSRLWRDEGATAWASAAQQASAGLARLSARDQARTRALGALLADDRPHACAQWQDLAAKDSFDFTAWFGAADCIGRDSRVVADSRSPSGWRFRSGYQPALAYYRRAFALNPALLAEQRPGGFERLRRILWTNGNDVRVGRSAGTTPRTFVAYPSLEHDTLAFVPFDAAAVQGASPDVMRRLPRNVASAIERQRRLFRDVAQQWAVASPASATAREALGLALAMLGDATAIDTLVRARRLATGPLERVRVMATEAWMRVQFAVPDNHASLRIATSIADSLLALADEWPGDARELAGMAALTGRANLAARLMRAQRAAALRAPTELRPWLSPSTDVFAAFGGPADTLRAIERRTDSLIAAVAPAVDRVRARSEALDRATTLAFPEFRFEAPPVPAANGFYLLVMQAAHARGDTSALRRLLGELERGRDLFAPPERTLDALRPEAWLRASLGDVSGAARLLDPTLASLGTAMARIDPVRAASLVRAMVLRADLASRVGDRAAAARWAAAVGILWANGDEFLWPALARMHGFAR